MKLFRGKNGLSEEDVQSIPMKLILRLKREINFLMLVNLIIAIAFIISTYDSIKIRDQIWDDHTAQVEEIVEHYCGEESWQN